MQHQASTRQQVLRALKACTRHTNTPCRPSVSTLITCHLGAIRREARRRQCYHATPSRHMLSAWAETPAGRGSRAMRARPPNGLQALVRRIRFGRLMPHERCHRHRRRHAIIIIAILCARRCFRACHDIIGRDFLIACRKRSMVMRADAPEALLGENFIG